ncbi:MAG: PLDc_N domain-containing protein [Coriobacteriia bacterium]|nr:PLDc_N domain-containing protein [Coriobacteriia bacterium]MBN2840533.1 PLDc_N domain-containing protein [Coriobacteriia bacterium]
MQTNIPLSDLPGWALPVIIVLTAVQLGVEIYALVVLFRTPVERLVFGKRWPWVLIILFVNLVGAIVFLATGRTAPVAIDPLAGPLPDAPTVSRAEHAVDVLYGASDDERTGGER